jgi:CBS domain-containing protein
MPRKNRLQVGDVMSSPVETIAPTASVQKAAQQMQAKDVSALLVRTSTAGIITSTDVVTAVADGNDLSSMEVSEVMTAAIETVTPELDLDEAAAMMTTYDIKHLPVVDDDYIGMLSSSDMTAVLT